MSAVRVVLFSCACAALTVACEKPPPIHQTHGMVFYDATKHPADVVVDKSGGFGQVAVPDVTVELRTPGSTAVVAQTTTDLEGHFRLAEAREGKYDLCWSADGWEPDCLDEPIEIKGQTFYAEPILIAPKNGDDVAVGDVRFADGTLCRLLDTGRLLDVTAEVSLSIPDEEAASARANAFGQFAIPFPGNTTPSVAATCADVTATQAKSGADALKAASGPLVAVTGDFATFDAPDAQAPPLVVSGSEAKHLTLAAESPRIAAFDLVDNQDRVVSRAGPGERLFAIAQLLSPTEPVRFWQATAGSVSPAESGGVEWKLPTELGEYQLDLLTANGAGGWIRETRTIRVTDDLRPMFSGTIKTSDGVAPAAAHVKVDVNGVSMPVDETGLFFGRIDPAGDARYVLRIEADNYLPVSLVYHRESSGATHVLERVAQSSFNAGAGGTLQFPAPFRKEQPGKSKEAKVTLLPGSLRNAAGPYAGMATARGAYLDPSARPLPGDYDATSLDGEDQSLISFGAVYVSLTDSAGDPLQIIDGQTAEIEVPLPDGRDPASAPPTIPIWYYNDATGFWEQDTNVATLNGSVYKGTVKHFSIINMDVGTVGNAVCVRVEVDFLRTPADRVLRATLTLPGGGTQVKQATLDNRVNAVYRLIPNQSVTFDLLRADGTDFPEFTLKDRRNSDAVVANQTLNLTDADKMDGVDLWPVGSQLVDCKPFVLATGDIQAPAAFYTRKQANATDAQARGRSEAYYAIMDPTNERLTLADWLTKNGFQPTPGAHGGFTFAPAAQVVSVSYLNHGDLGSGRKMHCRKDADRVACFVDNYAADNDATSNAFNLDPAAAVVAESAESGSGFATVAMELSAVDGVPTLSGYGHSDPRVVKFFTYGNGGGRVVEAALDRVSGNRWQPNVCMVCHGGEMPSTYDVRDSNGSVTQTQVPYPTSTSAVSALTPDQRAGLVAAFKDDGSSFREFDLGNLTALQGANAANKMRQLNCNYVRASAPNQEILDLIAAWYGPSCTEVGSPTQNEYIPPSFAGGHEDIYRSVAAKACRTCHIAQRGFEVDDHGAAPWSLMTSSSIQPYTCTKVMPQAAVTFHRYWLEGMHEKVLDEYGGPDCP